MIEQRYEQDSMPREVDTRDGSDGLDVCGGQMIFGSCSVLTTL